MVQSCQLSFDHPDNHYTTAIFKYMRDFSIFRNYSHLVCIDDEHSIKCGKPGYPVAAVERGKQVLVATDKPFWYQTITSLRLNYSLSKFSV